MKFIIGPFLLLLLLLPGAGRCQDRLAHAIDSLIRLKQPRFFNGVILISKNGKPLYRKAYGYSDLAKKTPLKVDDQFLVGSISKQFTAVLVLKEIQEGHIESGRTIRHYLPGFKQTWGDSVTVQQLLNHTSGITAWDKELAHAPGNGFSYSNVNYGLLGKIIEQTSGKNYAVLTAEMFAHCNMRSSSVPPGAGRKSNYKHLVKGHDEISAGRYEENNILKLLDLPVMGIPAGGMISTAGDLDTWMYCLHHGKLLAESTYRTMITQSVPRPHRWGAVRYADGIQVDRVDDIPELSMSGYVPGFIATMIYYPDPDLSLVVLENISPSASDMNRAFYFHDQVRNLVRNVLL